MSKSLSNNWQNSNSINTMYCYEDIAHYQILLFRLSFKKFLFGIAILRFLDPGGREEFFFFFSNLTFY